MKDRPGSVVRLAVPIRALTQRFAFILLIVVAFGLMLLGKAETVMVERIRAGVVDFVAPIMSLMSRPAATVTDAIADINEIGRLREENTHLRVQNERLLQWQAAARKLSAENDQFRQLLRFVPEPNVHSTSARVVADAGGVFVRSIIVAAGAREGIAKGQAVVTGDGLAGRVLAVGDSSARILLVTDLNSRIPVVLEDARERAILAGDNSSWPQIQFLRHNASVNTGDRVITSGHGGVLPPGLPIGIVANVGKGGIRVQPFVDLTRLEFVRILDYPEVSFGRSSPARASSRSPQR